MKVYVIHRKETSLLEAEVTAVTADYDTAESLIFHEMTHLHTQNYPVFLGDYEILERDLFVNERNPL